jgi:hypothetical protein
MNNTFFTRLGRNTDVKRAEKGLKAAGAKLTKTPFLVEAHLNGVLLFAAAKVNNILWACRYNKTFYS